MAKYELIPWAEACTLYDMGVREIACVAVQFGTECEEEAERELEGRKWEAHWLEPQWREYRVAALKWTYCIEVE